MRAACGLVDQSRGAFGSAGWLGFNTSSLPGRPGEIKCRAGVWLQHLGFPIVQIHHDPNDEHVGAIYEQQARLTRKVGRGMLLFFAVWLPMLLIVPQVFKQGAIASLLLATTAAVIVMIIVEHTWMKPRAAARERRDRMPPPPVDTRSRTRRFLDDLTARFQK